MSKSNRKLLGGHPSNVALRLFFNIRRARRHGLIVTATTDGQHAATSWHKVLRGRNKKGRAVDFGFSAHALATLTSAERRRRLAAYQREEYRRALRGRTRFPYIEVIGPLNTLCILGGRATRLNEGSTLEQAHDNHVHIAR